MAGDKDTAELVAFEHHLDVHGSRAERWTKEARQRFEPLLKQNERARELLSEAKALERVLDRAPLPDPRRIELLADRIVAAAVAQSVDRQDTARIIDLTARRQSRQPARSFSWKIASALAASLLVGIFIGSSPPVTSVVERLASEVGLPGATDNADLLLIDDAATEDEDFL